MLGILFVHCEQLSFFGSSFVVPTTQKMAPIQPKRCSSLMLLSLNTLFPLPKKDQIIESTAGTTIDAHQ